MQDKYFKCFKCKYHNNFYDIPVETKGRKCKRCHIFNYFNYHKKKKRNNYNNRNNYRKNKNTFLKASRNRLQKYNNSINIFNNHRTSRNQDTEPDSYISLNRYFNNYDNNIDNESESDRNDNFNEFNFLNPPNFYNESESNNYGLNIISFNQINNINNDYHFQNYIDNDNILNNYHNAIEESNNNIIKISWLKKENFTQDIIKKYGEDYICSICLEKIKDKEEINITKCNHIFHYNCIEKSINKNILNCPNCRTNLRTGRKNVNRNYFEINNSIERERNNNNIIEYNNNNNRINMIHNNDINENINNIINLIKNNKIIQIGLLLIVIIVIILFLQNVQYIEEKLLQIEI